MPNNTPHIPAPPAPPPLKMPPVRIVAAPAINQATLTAAKNALNQTAGPQRSFQSLVPLPATLRGARPGLQHLQAPTEAAVVTRFVLADKMPIGEMILPDPNAPSAYTLQFLLKNVMVPATKILPWGFHAVHYRYAAKPGILNAPVGVAKPASFLILPTIETLMAHLGFADGGWRWHLPLPGTMKEGSHTYGFHASVPKAAQKRLTPTNVVTIEQIIDWVFPKCYPDPGKGKVDFNGTHVSMERADVDNNSAWYRRDDDEKFKSGRGLGRDQVASVSKACRRKYDEWWPAQIPKLRAAFPK